MALELNACVELLDRRVASGDGVRTAIRCQGRSLTYDELLEEVRRAAAGLRAWGLQPEQRVLLALVARGMSREDAYAVVQELAMRGWRGEAPFRRLVEEDPRVRAVLSPAEIAACFDAAAYLRHVDFIFRRAGLDEPAGGEAGG